MKLTTFYHAPFENKENLFRKKNRKFRDETRVYFIAFAKT